MAGSVNKVILIGNLGRDPESRAFQNGGKVVNLRIATSENWKDRNTGERKEKTEWHSVAIFNEGLANVAEKYLRKGVSLEALDAIAAKQTDNEAAAAMQTARDKLLRKLTVVGGKAAPTTATAVRRK